MWDNEVEMPRLSMTVGEIVEILLWSLNENEIEEITEELNSFHQTRVIDEWDLYDEGW